MQILCTVDIRTRELYLEDVTIAAFDHLVDDILFVIEPIDGFQLETSTIKIAAVGPLGEPHDYEIDPSTVTVDEETGNINFVWSIPVGVTAMPLTAFKISDTKNITFAVCAEIVSGDNLVKAWHSDDGTIKVKAHLEPESGGGEDPSEEATNAQKIGQLQTDVAVVQRAVAAVAGGTPTVVDSTSDMTDTSKIYVLSTDSKWYYYDGSAWQIGGVYGGAVTSTTFTEQGVPADDFAVGEALAEKADADDVTALDTRVTALESNGSVPSEVRQAVYTLLSKALYTEAGLTDEIAAIQAWAESVTEVSVYPTETAISGTGTTQLVATTNPVGRTVLWSSSNENVATVSSTGLVTAVGNGTCRITAIVGNLSASCIVTVSGVVVSYSVTNNLTNCTNSNASASKIEGSSYTGTITANTGCYIDDTDITVSMGGIDITDTVLNNGVISIGSVTGNVVITATAIDALYPLKNGTFTFSNGTTVTITGHNHVDIVVTNAVNTEGFVDLSDLSENTSDYNTKNNVWNHPKKFTIPAGGTATFTISNMTASGTNRPKSFNALGTGTTALNIAISNKVHGTNSTTTTFQDATDVGCLFFVAKYSETVSFDVSFTVDGVKYV